MGASERSDGRRYGRCLLNATAGFLTLLTACAPDDPLPSTISALESYEPTLAKSTALIAMTEPSSSTTLLPEGVKVGFAAEATASAGHVGSIPATSTTVTIPATTVPPAPTTQTPAAFWDNVERWRPAVTEAIFAFGGDEADVHRFLRIMQCESAGLPDAKNPNSSASGLMQHLTRYWPDRAAAAGLPGADVFDPDANIWVSAWLALAAPGGGWKHWVCT